MELATRGLLNTELSLSCNANVSEFAFRKLDWSLNLEGFNQI